MESPVRPDDATSDTTSDAIKGDPAFRLIETLGWHPGEGGRHQPRHLARMRRSAAAFGIPFDPGQAEMMLADLASDTAMRCRLTLDAEGKLAPGWRQMSCGCGIRLPAARYTTTPGRICRRASTSWFSSISALRFAKAPLPIFL